MDTCLGIQFQSNKLYNHSCGGYMPAFGIMTPTAPLAVGMLSCLALRMNRLESEGSEVHCKVQMLEAQKPAAASRFDWLSFSLWQPHKAIEK